MNNKELASKVETLEARFDQLASHIDKYIIAGINREIGDRIELLAKQQEPKDGKTKKWPKFKIKDKVRGINPPVLFKVDPIGEIVRITVCSDGSFLYLVNVCDRLSIEFTEDEIELYKESKWEFTDDEKAILRNLRSEFTHIAKDKNGKVYLYTDKPYKSDKSSDIWFSKKPFAIEGFTSLFDYPNNLFQTIKWEDDEPCEFRKYL